MPGSTDWASENKVVLQSIKTQQVSPGVPPKSSLFRKRQQR